jgi:hypothetical protein
MAWSFRVQEILNQHGDKTGFWRLTATSDQGGGGPYPLCGHCHDSPEKALGCPDAQKNAVILNPDLG